jgi:hypothetical protein
MPEEILRDARRRPVGSTSARDALGYPRTRFRSVQSAVAHPESPRPQEPLTDQACVCYIGMHRIAGSWHRAERKLTRSRMSDHQFPRHRRSCERSPIRRDDSGRSETTGDSAIQSRGLELPPSELGHAPGCSTRRSRSSAQVVPTGHVRSIRPATEIGNRYRTAERRSGGPKREGSLGGWQSASIS